MWKRYLKRDCVGNYFLEFEIQDDKYKDNINTILFLLVVDLRGEFLRWCANLCYSYAELAMAGDRT